MRSILLTTCLISGVTLSAQVQHGGQPVDWSNKDMTTFSVDQTTLQPLSAALQNEVRDASVEEGSTFRFGTQRSVNIDILDDGATRVLADGREVTRVSINSPGAAMLSLQFSSFDMQPGDELFLYSTDRSYFLGAFNEENELPTGRWATGVIPGDGIVVEYIKALNGADQADLNISGVTHGIVDIFNFGKGGETRDYYPGYAAAACQKNIACPEGAGWEQIASSVALFLRADGHGCTGSLINNTRNDGTPYFYLANHCNNPPHDQWVFYFNYEAPLCVGDTGQTVETIVGSTLRAAEHFSDFVLLELFDSPQNYYDVYYAGWDRGNNIPQSGTILSHPAYDVKKISHDYDPVGAGTGTTIDPNLDTWVTGWDVGIAEFGASGASMFDQNKRIVGLVTEAWGDCSSLGGISASRFTEQWDGQLVHLRLRDWLDPDTLGNTFINGYNPSASVVNVPVKVFLEGPFDDATNLMNDDLRTATLIPQVEPYTVLGFTHYGEGGTETTTAGVLNTTGNNAIVDWVFVELRDKANSSSIVSTRSALLQRDGDVVEPDGVTPLTFLAAPDDYFVAVKHRNHLGVMTIAAVSISGTTATIDMTSSTGVALYGGNSTATNTVGGKQVLVPGDARPDNTVKYVGADNDRDDILMEIGGTVPTSVVSGYLITDTNLDGQVKYAGAANDRDVILRSIGGSILNAVRTASLP